MHPRQVLGIGERKTRELLVPRLPIDFDRRYEQRVPDALTVRTEAVADNSARLRGCLDTETRNRNRSRARAAASGTPTFLNRTARVSDGETVAWYGDEFDEFPLLWRLKLYAFQPLSSVVRGIEPGEDAAGDVQTAFDEWIRDWIETAEIGDRRYLRRTWTPWAVSLRIQHWLRYLAWRKQRQNTELAENESAFHREIYKNALFLRNHIEHDVGGNHLIENAAALVMAGLVFENAENDWIETGLSVFETAGKRQFLDDGCHFERSPMYHVMALARYLTVCDLLDRTGRAVPGTVRETAAEATAFLASLRPPDGSIPLLNDAVYEETLPLDACLRYADAVGIGANDRLTSSPETGPPTEISGYHWLRTDVGAMLVDGGPVGPPHLPGHSHSDTLGVLLWIGDQPVVTDTGTFDYVAGPRRDYARGVVGHNTVQVGESEPIAIGGQYLMGPRPVPESRIHRGEVSLFEGTYEARPFDGPAYTHHRATFAGDYWWIVHDTVIGHENSPVRSRLHLHPDIEPSINAGGDSVRLNIAPDETTDSAWIYPFGHARVDLSDGRYFPRFGEEIERRVLELRADDSGPDPARCGFLVTSRDIPPEDIEFDGDSRSSRLVIDGVAHRLPDCRLRSTDMDCCDCLPPW